MRVQQGIRTETFDEQPLPDRVGSLKRMLSLLAVCMVTFTCAPSLAQVPSSQGTEASSAMTGKGASVAVPSTQLSNNEGIETPTADIKAIRSDRFELRQVFIPETDLSILGDSFVPTDRKKLVELINSVRQEREADDQQKIPFLLNSTYVAKLVGQDLVSEYSEWTVERNGASAKTWTVPRTSIAWRQIPNTALDESTDPTSLVQFRPNGDAELFLQNHTTPVNFSWSASGKSTNSNSQIRFDVQLPPATVSRVLIELPPGWSIESTTNIAVKIDGVKSHLPTNWPDELLKKYNAGNWWLLQTSVAGKLLFNIEKETDSLSLPYKDIINRQDVEYNLSSLGLDVTIRTEFLASDRRDLNSIGPASPPTLKLQVDPRLGIRNVFINNRPVVWRTGGTENTIEIDAAEYLSKSVSRSNQIMINAISDWPTTEQEVLLPSIEWKGLFVIEGRTSVRLSNNWNAISFKPSLGHNDVSYESTPNSSINRLDTIWRETQPTILLAAAPSPSPQKVDILTRLTNSNDGFIATSRVLLPIDRSKHSTELIEVETGWTIDSIQTLDSSLSAAIIKSSKLQLDSVTEKTIYEISISPSTTQGPIDLEIVVKRGKLPDPIKPSGAGNTNENNLYFKSCQPLRLLNYKQNDIYIVESTGRYTIDANPSLIECRISDDFVPSRYHSMLPRIGDFWLIKPDIGRLPAMIFRRQAAPYTSEIETAILPNGTKLETRHSIRCIPVAGAVSGVVVSFPNATASMFKWRFRPQSQTTSDDWLPIEVLSIENKKQTDIKPNTTAAKSSSTDGPQRYRLTLPRSMSVPFEIETIHFSEFGTPIDFPSTPEATQVRARVDIESSLVIAETKTQSSEPRYQPQGDRLDKSDFCFYRYQFNPAQVFRIEVRRRSPVESSWIDGFHINQVIYPQGTRTAEIRLSLHRNQQPQFKISLPSDWTIRRAYLDDVRPLPVIRNDASLEQWAIDLPKQKDYLASAQSISLTIYLDGPSIELEDGQTLDWPQFNPHCDVMKSTFSVVLPDGYAISEKDTYESESNAWAYRKNDFTTFVLDDRASLYRWVQRNLFSYDASSIPTEPITISDPSRTTLLSTTMQSNQWLLSTVVLCFLSYGIGLRSWKFLSFALGASILLLPFTPAVAIDWIFCTIVALSLATLLLITRHLVCAIQGCVSQQPNVAISKSYKQMVQVVIPFAALLFAIPQEIALAEPGETVDANENSALNSFYSVIFPIDDKGELSGDIAYVGEAFLKLLNRRSKTQSNLNYLLSARHELSIDSSLEETFKSSNCKVICRYEWNIQDSSKAITVPLPKDYQSLLSLKIDGMEQGLGTRFQSSEASVVWLPSKTGKSELEISYQCGISIDVRNQLSVQLPILPIANTVVEIFGQSIADITIDSAGQVTNPSLGRYSVSLGKRSEISLQWRQNLARASVRSIKGDLDTEWAILQDQSIAKCKLLIEGELMDSNKVEIECEQPWEPIGSDWGDGNVTDIVAGSTNLKRRFRIQWKDGVEQSRRHLELFLRRNEGKVPTILNPPVIEISGARIESRTITIAQYIPGEWALNKSNAWISLPLKSQFLWLSSPFQEMQSLKTLDPSATFSLKRILPSQQIEVSARSNLLFQSNLVNGVTEFAISNSSPIPPSLNINTPAGTTIESIQFGDKEIPTFEMIEKDDQNVIQVITDASLAKSRLIRVHFRQNYSGSSAWHLLPFVELSGTNTLSHKTSVNALIDLPLEFDGIESILNTSTNDVKQVVPSVDNVVIQKSDLPPRILAPNLPFELFQRKTRDATVTDTDKETENQSLHPHLWTADLLHQEIVKNNFSKSEGGTPPIKVRYRILPSIPEMQGHIISSISVEESTWRYSLTGSVTRKTWKTSGLLLDVPSGIADSLQSDKRITKYDSSEAGRRLVIVSNDGNESSGESDSDNTFTFSIDCNLEKSQTTTGVSLPNIRLLNGPSVDNWLVVPKSKPNQPLNWTTSGVRQARPTQIPSSDPKFHSNDLLWFQPVSSQPEIQLNELQTLVKSASIEIEYRRLTLQSANNAKLESFFLVDPNGTSHLELRIPKKSFPLAIYVNDEVYPAEARVDSTDSKTSLVRLPLQSSVLPQFIKIVSLVRLDDLSNPGYFSEVDFPIFETLLPMSAFLEVDDSLQLSESISDSVQWTPVSHPVLVDRIIEAMSSCSELLSELATDANTSQKTRWWNSWQSFSIEQIFYNYGSVNSESVEKWITARDQILEKWNLDPSPRPKWVLDQLSRLKQSAQSIKTSIYTLTKVGPLPKPELSEQVTNPKVKAPPSLKSQIEVNNIRFRAGVLNHKSIENINFRQVLVGLFFIMASLPIWIRPRLFGGLARAWRGVFLCPWRFLSLASIPLTIVSPLSWLGPTMGLLSLFLVLKQYLGQGRLFPSKLAS